MADDAGDSGVTRQQGWGADTNPSTAGGRSSTSRRNQKAATLGGGGSFFDSKQKYDSSTLWQLLVSLSNRSCHTERRWLEEA